MIVLTTEDWLLISSVISFFICGFASSCFGRISVKYIEAQMAKEGIPAPEWDKGIGTSHIMYAMAIVIKRKRPMILIDSQAIRRHARKKDWYLAVFFMIALSVFMTLMSIFYYLYGPEA